MLQRSPFSSLTTTDFNGISPLLLCYTYVFDAPPYYLPPMSSFLCSSGFFKNQLFFASLAPLLAALLTLTNFFQSFIHFDLSHLVYNSSPQAVASTHYFFLCTSMDVSVPKTDCADSHNANFTADHFSCTDPSLSHNSFAHPFLKKRPAPGCHLPFVICTPAPAM